VGSTIDVPQESLDIRDSVERVHGLIDDVRYRCKILLSDAQNHATFPPALTYTTSQQARCLRASAVFASNWLTVKSVHVTVS
jgi:hypothetical protein